MQQFTNFVNDAIGYCLGRCADTTNNQNGFYGTTSATIATGSQLNNDFIPTYQVLTTNYMVWYDYAVIRLNTLFESLSAICLTNHADMLIRFYLNTGTLNVAVSSPNTTTPLYSLAPTYNSFNSTCDLATNGGLPPDITARLNVAKVPSTTYQGANLGLCGASHQFLWFSYTAPYSLGDFSYKSPFDTFPGDFHPLSLINLKVEKMFFNQS